MSSLFHSDRLNPWRLEASALLRLGAPMALTQLIQFSVNTVDVLMIGRLGPEPLAASSLGLVLFYAGWLLGIGPALAVSPMVSQAIGARGDDHIDVRRSVRMCLWAIALSAPVFWVVFLFTEQIILAFGQSPELARTAAPYVIALAPGLPFALGVMCLRNYLAALDRTRVPLFIVLGVTLLNAFLNWLFIFGNLGLPRLELIGAGLASSLSNFAGFAALGYYCTRDARSKPFDIFGNFFRSDWPRFREVFALGWPISLTTAFEAMLFNACIFIVGRIGVAEVAAYQIALNVAAIAFMAPLGLSMAGAVRVGLHAGAGDREGARRASLTTIYVCVGAIMIVAIPVALAPYFVAGLYLDRGNPENARVLELIVLFLRIAVGFMVFDAIQVAANQSLRGLKDVRAPMIITAVVYWLIGFPTAYWLGLMTPVGSVGVWFGLTAALAAAAILLTARLLMLTRRVGPPAPDRASEASPGDPFIEAGVEAGVEAGR